MFKQYTHCVSRSAYQPLVNPTKVLAFVGIIIGAILGGGVGVLLALIAGYSFLKQLCDYLLGGKLICLGPARCAIGRIMELEPLGYNKSFPMNIDDDYSIDLLLAPHLPPSTPNDVQRTLTDILNDGGQGNLMVAQPASGGLPFTHYFTDQDLYYPEDRGGGGPPQQLQIPVFHGEFEGSRIADVCSAAGTAMAIAGAAAVVCAIPIFGWIACAIAGAVGVVVIAALLISAWFGASDGSPSDAAVNPDDGNLHSADNTGLGGDYVVITGDWVYDAGHNFLDNRGWNEFHPIKSVQKIPNAPYWQEGEDPATAVAFGKVLGQWCDAIAVIDTPPVQTNQRQPENQWVLHPDVDGCEPADGDQTPT